jgi:hypothetical protein
MTRGRPPKKAVKEAVEPARGRGGVVELPDTCGLPYDLMIFSPSCIVFVKVKRMRAQVQGPPDVEIKYCPEIRALRILPESGAARMELWILSSHTMWQYFRVLSDSIVEIRIDGTTITSTGKSTGDCSAAPLTFNGVPAPLDFPLPAINQEKRVLDLSNDEG